MNKAEVIVNALYRLQGAVDTDGVQCDDLREEKTSW
jgi:hypothetical protein